MRAVLFQAVNSRLSRTGEGAESEMAWPRGEMKRGLLPSFSSAVQWLFSRSRSRYYPHSPLLKIVTHSKIYKEMHGFTHTCQDVYLDEFLGKYWRLLVYCSPNKRQTRGFCEARCALYGSVGVPLIILTTIHGRVPSLLVLKSGNGVYLCFQINLGFPSISDQFQ